MSGAMLSVEQAELIIAVAEQVLIDGATLDRAYSKVFAGKRLASSDQALISSHAGALLRKLNYYAAVAEVNLPIAPAQLQSLVAVYFQLHQLRSPAIRIQLSDSQLNERVAQLQQYPALVDGCPEWLDILGQQQLAERWPAERAALAAEPKRYVRANLLKTTTDKLASRLANEGISSQAVVNVATALEITNNASLFRTESYNDGWFEQQDAGSQMVAEVLDVKPGMRVIDACAGNGGKTLAIAAMMQGKGRLLAMDVEQWKLDNLKKRAKRAGAHNIETRLITSSKTIKRIAMSADRVLLDVPCSGLGVLKRHPDTKWGDTESRLPVLAELQAHILGSYSRMLKVDGILVYATCSIMPSENRAQVQRFVTEKPQFELIEDSTVWPSETGFDGFYWAKIKRIAE
ncbi:RsmB/NOP family class I SAM-dependent RNA methyltransferase [Shewanella avicenniae]|uniref:RsmB/NOP family class I SAM-dependent RNA methyltransferase n=1 Tax=Shewanella avicenniae TaxID=2814294 RepID=A0ABX7QMQ3_9GAMM|nr:RsmB/NOP family class I SAM-dependent RNA methyltransferase [Shewanella avicenniae]QSX32045.1 RsmB/NOP family class I SAM-dependent RNA methyltransferase [Shewanella avicenniae]